MPSQRHVEDGLRKPWGTIIAFLLPASIFYTALTAYPAVRTFWNSFHRVLPRREEFVGLANYAELCTRRHLLARGAQHDRLGLRRRR